MAASLVAPSSTASLRSPACQRLVLTGFMGAGKTTVGRLLASRLSWSCLDLDHAIEQQAGCSIAAIFAQDGEPHLRRLETRALARALAHRQVVIALGGGAPETVANRLLLEQTPGTVTVFLAAPFATLYDRCLLQALEPDTAVRPNLADPALAELRFADRQRLYRRLAHHTIEVAELSRETVADHLLALLVR